MDNIKNSEQATAITGKNFWLVGITLAESALAVLDYNWLWSGLLVIHFLEITKHQHYVNF